MNLYKCGSGGYSNYTDKASSDYTSSTSHTYSGLTVGKVYLLLLWAAGSSTLGYQRFDGASASGATLTKITNLNNANMYGTGTFYKMVATSTSATVTHTNAFRSKLFLAE